MTGARFLPRARLDLEEMAERIAAVNLGSAIHFCRAVEDALQKLSEMPGMGPVRWFPSQALAGLRSWPIKGFRNYLIFYRAVPDGIEVVRLLHAARDIDAIFSQG